MGYSNSQVYIYFLMLRQCSQNDPQGQAACSSCCGIVVTQHLTPSCPKIAKTFAPPPSPLPSHYQSAQRQRQRQWQGKRKFSFWIWLKNSIFGSVFGIFWHLTDHPVKILVRDVHCSFSLIALELDNNPDKARLWGETPWWKRIDGEIKSR